VQPAHRARGRADTGLTGRPAFAWCGHGVFSVAVTVVAGDVERPPPRVRAVLPPSSTSCPRLSATLSAAGRVSAIGPLQRR
jgi:hypothetical protein